MKPKLAFLTGLSGTGKSTLVRFFRGNPISGWGVFDFDEAGEPVPKNRSEHHAWRMRQTQWWLSQDFNKDTVIIGLSLYPSALLMLPEAKDRSIHFGLLNVSHEVRKERIHERGTPDAWQGVQDWYSEFFEELKRIQAKEFDTEINSAEQTAQEVRAWLQSLT